MAKQKNPQQMSKQKNGHPSAQKKQTLRGNLDQ